jgi:hypothetical protein
MALQQREVFLVADEEHGGTPSVGLYAPAIAATGSITIGEAANGNTVTISDGVNPALTFEFDTGAAAAGAIVLAVGRPAIGNTITLHGVTFELTDGTGAEGDNVEIDISDNADLTADGVDILTVIKATIAGLNNAGTTGALDTTYTITLAWGTVGEAGNSTVTKVGDNITVTSMTGGLDPGDDVTPGNVGVAAVSSGGASAANLLAAINAAAALDITASHTDPASATINLTNDTPGAAGNVTITKVGAPITVTGMAGGLDTVDLYTLAAQIAPVAPATVSRLRVSKNTSGDNVLIAAPTSPGCIYYEYLKLQNNSDSPITALIKFGASDSNYDPTYMATKGEGYIDAPPRGYVKLPAATALIVNLDVTGKEVIGNIRYWIAA